MGDPKRALFESVVRLLTPVLDELVFVGGCTTGLFLTDATAGGVGPTKDVDAIVDVARMLAGRPSQTAFGPSVSSRTHDRVRRAAAGVKARWWST